MRAALDEFAEHGFHGASLNRVIETAGISKGSMYYYFESKEGLYAHVARAGISELLGAVGSLPALDSGDADEFWRVLEDYYLRLMMALSSSPQLAALLRGWMEASRGPAFHSELGAIEQEAIPWIEQVVVTGQRVGAVRDDLPSSLLLSVALGMGEAMDLWLMTQPNDSASLPGWIHGLVEMMRGAFAPQGPGGGAEES